MNNKIYLNPLFVCLSLSSCGYNGPKFSLVKNNYNSYDEMVTASTTFNTKYPESDLHFFRFSMTGFAEKYYIQGKCNCPSCIINCDPFDEEHCHTDKSEENCPNLIYRTTYVEYTSESDECAILVYNPKAEYSKDTLEWNENSTNCINYSYCLPQEHYADYYTLVDESNKKACNIIFLFLKYRFS